MTPIHGPASLPTPLVRGVLFLDVLSFLEFAPQVPVDTAGKTRNATANVDQLPKLYGNGQELIRHTAFLDVDGVEDKGKPTSRVG
jgi:hypothetical protein